jgi:hypothetical protein
MTYRPVIAVIAGPSVSENPVLVEVAAALGRKLADAGYDIACAPGNITDALATAAQEAGASVVQQHKFPTAVFAFAGPGNGVLREALQSLEQAVPVILVDAGPHAEGIRQFFDRAVAAGQLGGKDSVKFWSPADDIAAVLPRVFQVPGLYAGLGR